MDPGGSRKCRESEMNSGRQVGFTEAEGRTGLGQQGSQKQAGPSRRTLTACIPGGSGIQEMDIVVIETEGVKNKNK